MELTFEQLPAGVSLLLQKIEQMEQALSKLTSGGTNDTTEEVRLNMREAAKHLGCSVQTLQRAKDNNRLPFHQFGKIVYFLPSELDAATLVPMDVYVKK